MKRIAITGGIGSGKSYVCSMFRRRGFQVYDCDSAAKRIMHESPVVRKELVALLGTCAYVDGRLNKPLLRSYILSNEQNALNINAIVHPVVADDFLSSGIGIMECAILFSSGFDRLVDKVICVSAPYDVRLRRVMSRDGVNEKTAASWISSQMSQEEVMSRSDFVIMNDGNFDVEYQLDDAIAVLEI